jgi:chemotaxis signal transduction protein
VTGDATQDQVRLGLMSSGGITVGIDVACVAEVCPVRRVSRLLAGNPGLLGAIELRGDSVPLLDPLPLAGLPGLGQPEVAIIVASDGRRIALGFEAVEGLIHVPRGRIEGFDGGDGAIFAGTLEDRGRIVSILDPRKLLSRPDIPSARTIRSGRARAMAEGSASYLTFESGGARFGMAATDVEATVPRQQIEPHSLAEGAWLGMIRHHGRRVPVMHLNAILGMGEIGDLRIAEVVVIRFPDGRFVGFAVGAIRQMQLVPQASRQAVPPLVAAQTLGIGAVVCDGSDAETFLVDLDSLRADPALRSMATLSEEREAPAQTSAAAPPPETRGAIMEWERYLVAQAGVALAIPVRQIARIVTPPAQVTPFARAPDWALGVFRGDEGTIPLIDLARRLGHGRTEMTEHSRVLLTSDRDAVVGFAVDSVDHLAWSAWRSDNPADDSAIRGMVSLPRLGDRSVFTVIDLRRIDPTRARSPEAA